jgi:hypothetical protein
MATATQRRRARPRTNSEFTACARPSGATGAGPNRSARHRADPGGRAGWSAPRHETVVGDALVMSVGNHGQRRALAESHHVFDVIERDLESHLIGRVVGFEVVEQVERRLSRQLASRSARDQLAPQPVQSTHCLGPEADQFVASVRQQLHRDCRVVEYTRTRVASFAGTSTTTSSNATRRCATERPTPFAPSTAHTRSG